MFTRTRFTRTRWLCAAALSALGAHAAQAETLSYAGGWPSSAGANGALESYARAVEANSGGELKVKVYPLSLLNFAEANAGVKDGIADMATILTPYFAAEFPRLNMMAEASPMMGLEDFASPRSFMAFAGAMSELILTRCPGCLEEIAAQNQVFMGASATTSYILQCVTPAGSLEDLAGLRIRTAGPFWSRWVEAMGATPVTISINETFEALNQGVLDCTASNPTDMTAFRFIEAVDHVVDGAPGGQFPLPTMINRDRWQGLDAQAKAAIMQANARLMAEMAWVYHEDGLAAFRDAAERGVEIAAPAPDLAEKSQAFIEADLTSVAGAYREKYGIEDSEAMLGDLRELVGKWTVLIAEAETADALATVYWDEIYSKVDLAAYGG